MFECVIVVCIHGENHYRYETLDSTRQLKKLATHLDWLVALGKCEKYCIMFSGEIVRGM